MKKNNNIDLQITSIIIFILCSIVSLSISFNQKNNIFYSKKDEINISFYNRIIILFSLLLSLYVSYNNLLYKNDENEIYKGKLLLLTNLLTICSSIIIIYVAYLNKTENSFSESDLQNTLI